MIYFSSRKLAPYDSINTKAISRGAKHMTDLQLARLIARLSAIISNGSRCCNRSSRHNNEVKLTAFWVPPVHHHHQQQLQQQDHHYAYRCLPILRVFLPPFSCFQHDVNKTSQQHINTHSTTMATTLSMAPLSNLNQSISPLILSIRLAIF